MSGDVSRISYILYQGALFMCGALTVVRVTETHLEKDKALPVLL